MSTSKQSQQSDTKNKLQKESDAQLNNNKQGAAGVLCETFIHSPLSPLLYIVMLLLGIYGLFATPRQEDPEISVPMIDIFYQMPGATIQQVSELLIAPQERVLSEINDIKHVYSASDKEMGMITLQYKVGEDMESALIRTMAKLQANTDKLPPGAKPAMMKPKGIDDVPVVTMTLWSRELDDSTLRALATTLEQRLKQIPQTGNSFISGGRARELRIDITPERLVGYGLSMGQIAQVIQGFNNQQTVGFNERGDLFAYVETGAFLRSANDVRQLVVGLHKGHPIFMRDVAKVTIGPEQTSQMVSFSSGPAYSGAPVDNAQAVTLAIAKHEGSNGVEVVQAIRDKVESLKGVLIPDNVHIEYTRDYGKSASDKVNGLLSDLMIASVMVMLLVWFTMGFKPSVVVFMTVPLVLTVTIFSGLLMDYSINRVSLFALIFSIGFLVDNAIVIIDNMYRRWLIAGTPSTAIAIDAVREVGNPTILASFCIVAALAPMGFVSGMMGPYMEPIPALGSVAMLFSLFVALVFAPWMAMRIIPSMPQLKAMAKRDKAIDKKISGIHEHTFGILWKQRSKGRLFLLFLLLSFIASAWLFYSTHVTVKMLPYDNKSEFQVVVNMPAGTALPETASFTEELAQIIRIVPEVISVQTYSGTAIPFDFNGLVRHYYLRMFPWQGQIQVTLLDKKARSRTSHEIAMDVRKLIEPIIEASGIRAKNGSGVTVVEMPPGPPVLQTVVAEVHGPDAATRKQVAQDLKKIFDQSKMVGEAETMMREPMTIWRFDINTTKAALNGISIKSINQNLAMAMGMFKVSDLKEKGLEEPTRILLQVPLSMRADLNNLNSLPIMTPAGTTVPLGQLGKFVEEVRESFVIRKDLRPIEYVVADATGRLAAPVYAQIDVSKLLENYITPDGVSLKGEYLGPPESDAQSGFEWGGEWTVTFETFRDMGIAYGVALLAIYMLVVWQFGNFLIPLVIMAPIPLTLLGISPGHWLFSTDFTATSMIGWIALAGIIVRNSILLVDTTLQQINNGQSLYDAVINSAISRTRPILITAISTMVGAAIILADPIFGGMAVSLLFGLLVSTVLTLVVVPLGCLSIGEETFRKVAQHQDCVIK
ncbi:efflux RND transporter permease subunit [sulfur-oxidizing endosymbiont of Gigantopelta aegis]|uniref:efflux RND transporter permease subunit n=1 Tax=sulfur-oxidizing endosymbiont of Gigantopelta aegis TaxID=2794934 RepID=UPI0018DD0DA6|nr:efflux RND transporter permease subunit [sulfur-oxidizing endosymbiont of Gigantopelta aegis]